MEPVEQYIISKTCCYNAFLLSLWLDNGLATCSDEYSCLYNSLSDNERKALEAIRTLHSQLDDDADGNIDLSESDEVSLSLSFFFLPYCLNQQKKNELW